VADLGMFSMFDRTGALQKGSPTGQRTLDSSATFSGLWGPLYGVLQFFKSLLGAAQHHPA